MKATSTSLPFNPFRLVSVSCSTGRSASLALGPTLSNSRVTGWLGTYSLGMNQVVHFEIHADDPHRAIAFYTGAFGWTVEQMGSEDYWLATTTPQGGVGINGAIMRRRGPRPEIGAPIVGAVVTVQVEDVDAALTSCVKLGGHVALERVTIPNVGAVAYVHDTEANVLGIFQSVTP